MKKNFKEKYSEFINQLPYLPKALSLVWSAARPWTVAWGVLLVVQGVLPVATVYLTRDVVDSLVYALSVEIMTWDILKVPLFYVALMALVLLLTEILRSITAWVRTAQSELVSDHISGIIHTQAIALDLSFFEDSSYYDTLHRARVDAMSKPVALLENMGSLIQNGITLIAMSGVLLAYSVWLPLILLGSTLPALWVVARSTIRFHAWRLRNTEAQRRTRYLDWMLTDQRSAAEIRIFDLGRIFQKNFQQVRTRLRTERLKLLKDEMWRELLAGVLGLTVTGLTLAWMIWRVIQGTFSLGDLALFYQAFNQGQRVMRSLLRNAGDIYKNLLFLENLFDFLNLRSKISDPVEENNISAKIHQAIKLENVDFAYPGSERLALKNFNLTIPAKKIVALVGENGAGKSTLIKLICRFYDPVQGKITFDGNDLRDLKLKELRRLITVLFQVSVQYQDTVRNNIAFGDLESNPGLDEIKKAAHAAGADIPVNKLPTGYETIIGRWFGGGELSVGEWQRISLARAFLRKAQLIILDEPTSAMDSWAEADWLARFRDLVADQTALIVTHRFTTAMQADIIHVMDAGRIVESGKHAELMAQDGLYAKSWRQQTRAGMGDV